MTSGDDGRSHLPLDAALDCVICIDDEGHLTYLNEAAQQTFGYVPTEVVGNELADVIVPPALREAHRRGLQRLAGGGQPSILGRRLELTAMRADGTEFPAELTVTRLRPPNGPGFIGFVRDITERLRIEEELRASRSRLEVIATEQAALRRVATLVARQGTADKLFATVALEVALLLGAQWSTILRYDPVGTVTLVGVYGRGPQLAVGESWKLEAAVAAQEIWRTGQPAAVDVNAYDTPLAVAMLSAGLRFATGVPILVEGRLWGAITVLNGEPHGPGDDLVRRLESFTELVATAVANAATRSALVAAQRRLIETADAARAKVTRDMHDGAQQRFVNSLINLQLAEDKWSSELPRAREFLRAGTQELDAGIASLREVAAGLHPTILSDLGLGAALESLTARMPIPVALDVSESEVPGSLRTSVYFFCSEALTNITKHSNARGASVRVVAADGWLSIEVRDDGVGGAEIGFAGSGLLGLSDRVGALDGSLIVSSPPGGGTALIARVPCPHAP